MFSEPPFNGFQPPPEYVEDIRPLIRGPVKLRLPSGYLLLMSRATGEHLERVLDVSTEPFCDRTVTLVGGIPTARPASPPPADSPDA